MKVKTSEATPIQVNWMVAKCVNPAYGMVRTHQDNKDRWHVKLHGEIGNYAPSTDWALAGPIIDREEISVQHTGDAAKWRAHVWSSGRMDFWPVMYGSTPLIAAMRCYVASKLGAEVDVPEELK